MRNNTIRFLIAGSLTAAMIFFFSVSAFAAQPGETLTVACSDGLNLRSAPYGDILTGIPCGSSVCVVSDDGSGWILVNYDGFTGYVCAEYLSSYYNSPDSSGFFPAENISQDYSSAGSSDSSDSYSRYGDSADASGSSTPGYYDDYGNWIAYDVTSYAGGYYDRYGSWVDWTPWSDSGEEVQSADEFDSRARSAGQAVADLAVQYVGLPYVWGSESLTSGADCSGFTRAIYEQFGVDLYHYDLSQREQGYPVASLDEALPGDLVFYEGHVAIYIGDGKIVHAANSKDDTIISNADYSPVVCIRRIF
ncbi:MAG: SH3 domain-containing C40 family peptidase [Eubacteriales bacterium]|nr:SH3 domain-containing C40 family peptidase [Eubacteriales bacterium]